MQAVERDLHEHAEKLNQYEWAGETEREEQASKLGRANELDRDNLPDVDRRERACEAGWTKWAGETQVAQAGGASLTEW